MSVEIFVKYLLAFAIVFDAALAWFVLLKNPRRPINQAYFFMVLWITVWQVSNFMLSYYLVDSPAATLLQNISYAALAGLVAAGVYFVLIFPNQQHLWRFFFLTICFGLIFALASIVSPVPLVENSLLYPLYFMYALIALATTISIGIYRWFVSSEEKIRQQFQYLLLGFFIPAVFISFTNVYLPSANVLNNTDNTDLIISTAIHNFGVASTVFFSVIMAFAIMRHRLLSLIVVIPRRIIGLILSGIILLALLIIPSLFSTTVKNSLFIFIFLESALFIVLIKPFSKLVEVVIKRAIKPELVDLYKHSPEDLILISKSENPEKLARFVAEDCYKKMAVESVTFIYYDNFARYFRVEYPVKQKQLFARDEPWSCAFIRDPQIFSVEEVAGKKWGPREKKSVQNFCRQFGAAHVIPIKYGIELMGVVLLGDKVNQEPISDQEKKFLHRMQERTGYLLWHVAFFQSIVRKGIANGFTLSMLPEYQKVDE